MIKLRKNPKLLDMHLVSAYVEIRSDRRLDGDANWNVTQRKRNEMKKKICLMVLSGGLATSAALAGMGDSDAGKLPPGHPPVSSYDTAGSVHQDGGGPVLSGEIVETMDTGNYTYVLLKTADKSIWAATEQFDAVIGSRVSIPRGMLVKDFESPTLGRKFDELYFADAINVVDSTYTAPDADKTVTPEQVDSVEQPEGGMTVADVYQRRREIAGSTVTVRGKVFKYTERVMGRNWLHIADGTGDEKHRDLTVNTLDTARLGDVVTVSGPVAIDEDLGYGYFYEVVIKDAKVTRE